LPYIFHIDHYILAVLQKHPSLDSMGVAFGDDQMRARTKHIAHNLAVLKHMTVNLIRFDPVPRKAGIKLR
jgi:hypothetical protein